MSEPEVEHSFALVEQEIRRLWAAHGLPPPGGVLGHGTEPVLRQLEGTYTPGDPPVLVAQRAVAADVDARATALGAGRVEGTLRREGWPAGGEDPVVAPLLRSLAVWTGGEGGRPYDAVERTAGVQAIASRLARAGILVAGDGPIRLCPSCAAPRSPERTIYHEEIGDTFLVRFPLEPVAGEEPVEALAWVDAPWRLLGTTALLMNPDLAYATVQYRRGDVEARLLILRSSIDRLRAWLPGAELTVLAEKPGRAYTGRRYVYPLRHEFPDGASLAAPSGTIQAVPEVGDSGTGVVPLVPGHGGTDAQIAERLGVHGWPLLTIHGTLELTLMHKYSGLDLETATEFVARDLTEGGSVLARLRVLRGVPYCGVCGRPVVWTPGRCWCLEPGRLPAEQLAQYAALLPGDRPVAQIELTAWPVSETRTSDAPEAVTLLECERCPRLDAPDGPTSCPCGGKRRPVARRLVPSVAGAFGAWARLAPLPSGEPVRLYISERRRAPTIVHLLAAMAGAGARVAELQATILPTVSDVDVVGLVAEHGADAVRAAFVRLDSSEGPGGSFVERCRQERRRFARLAELAASTAAALEREAAGTLGATLSPNDRELQPEDRALLARWSATELKVLAAYDEFRAGEAHRRLARFLEVDLARYREIVRPRLAAGEPPAGRRAALRTLGSVLAQLATALAPVAPFTAEAVVRTLRPDPRSLFETEPFDVEHAPADEAFGEAWERWVAVVRAVDRFRTERHLAPGTLVPLVALVVTDDQLGDQLRGDRSLLERLARIGRLEVGSPRTPWEGRRRQLVPVESEIQKAYPTLATQILYLLKRTPPRRPGEQETARGFSVFVQGQPHQITPSMLALVETLPDRVVPVAFGLGEMYAEVPATGAAASGGPSAVLSADAAWLVRRVGRRLRRVGPEASRALAVRIVAVDPLAKELRERWAAVAAALGVARLTIDAAPGPESVPPAVTGRTRLGTRWSVEIPGLLGRPPKSPRPAPRGGSGASRRMPIRQRPTPDGGPEVDYTDGAVIGHEDAVRALGEQLDKLLDAPLLGPSKVAIAWDAGYASVEEIRSASFDELATLPGFGRPVAARLFAKLGRDVPAPPPRPVRTPRTPPARSAPLPLRPAAPTALAVEAPGALDDLSRVSVVLPALPTPERELTSELSAPAPATVGPTSVAPPAGPPPAPTPPAAPAPLPPAPLPPPARAPPPPPPPVAPAFVSEADRAAGNLPTPPLATAPVPAAGLEVELSEALLPALQPFLEATAAGHRGVAVVRELPERIRTLVGPRPVAVYWLSNLARDRAIRPSDLRGLADLLRQGLESSGITAVFLEGTEYLTRIHGSEAVVAFLKELDRQAREHEARAWLHLTPGLLTPTELDRFVSDLGLPSPQGSTGGVAEPAPPAGAEIPAATAIEPVVLTGPDAAAEDEKGTHIATEDEPGSAPLATSEAAPGATDVAAPGGATTEETGPVAAAGPDVLPAPGAEAGSGEASPPTAEIGSGELAGAATEPGADGEAPGSAEGEAGGLAGSAPDAPKENATAPLPDAGPGDSPAPAAEAGPGDAGVSVPEAETGVMSANSPERVPESSSSAGSEAGSASPVASVSEAETGGPHAATPFVEPGEPVSPAPEARSPEEAVPVPEVSPGDSAAPEEESGAEERPVPPPKSSPASTGTESSEAGATGSADPSPPADSGAGDSPAAAPQGESGPPPDASSP